MKLLNDYDDDGLLQSNQNQPEEDQVTKYEYWMSSDDEAAQIKL